MSIIDKSIQKLEQSKQQAKKVNQSSEEENQDQNASLAQTAPQANIQEEVKQSSVSPEASSSEVNNRVTKISGNKIELNHQLLKERGFISDITEKSVHSEEFRSLKRKVINNAFGQLSKTLDANNLIMVTSCSPNEGKTFNSINLALSIAKEKDKTVLLVDSDVLRPSISQHLDFEAEYGLTDYLNGKVDDLRDVMLTTNVEKLRILPAGNFYSLSSELLASNKMVELMNEFASRYKDRIVIFDAPPMLGVNETAVLADLVGQILIVVEEDQTQLGKIQQLIGLLPEKAAKGFIMNKSVTAQTGGYGYGY